jgi:thioredoxin reductase
MMRNVDVAVVGGGPAGLAAALAAHKAGARSILVLERDTFPGGILQQCIHNGFGLHYFGQELTGPEYAQRFLDEVEKIDSIEVLLNTMVLSVAPDRQLVAVSSEHGMVRVQAKAVVLAMGCRERTRGALNIPGTRPAGVYTAGCAQRLVNMEGMMPGKRVMILGSGDIGLIMARRMVWEGAKVEMVCEIMPYSSGLNRNIVQCLEDNNIPLYFNTTVVNIHGKERVEGVTIAQVDPATREPKMETARYVPCDTLLLSVGLIPENELTLGTGAQMDPVTSGAQVDAERQTSVPGIFACGNVLHVHDLVDNVSEEAAIAGENAAKFALGTLQKAETVRVLPEGGVRYVVPQRLVKGEGKAALYFRVRAAFQPARLTVLSGGKEIKSVKKRIMTPGEMEKTIIDLGDVTGDVVVRVEEG